MTSSELANDVAAELERAFGWGTVDIAPFRAPDSTELRVSTSNIDGDTNSTQHNAPYTSQAEPRDAGDGLANTPVHPIPCLQEEFNESIMESMDPPSPKSPAERGDAASRRRQLLELEDFSDEYSSRWTQKPDAKFHPLRKLVAQISYGIYLLHTKKAISEPEVIRILQGHVDEIDGFVEDTLADFELARKDITERVDHLMLPLEHSRTFNRMLCDRPFRDAIILGNEIIERVIVRTSSCMGRAMDDVEQGLGAILDLSRYLKNLGEEWKTRGQDLMDVYGAMQGNAEGWATQFKVLQLKSQELERLMLRLGYIVDEVAKRCGIASRRKTPSGVVARRADHRSPDTQAPALRTSLSSNFSTRTEKPLPAPPRRISTNPSVTKPRASILPSPATATENRPSLSSSPSLQSLDCLHRPSKSPSNESERPNSCSSASPRTVRFQATASPRSPLARVQSQETTLTQSRLSPDVAWTFPRTLSESPEEQYKGSNSPKADTTARAAGGTDNTGQIHQQTSLAGLGITGSARSTMPQPTVSTEKEVVVGQDKNFRPLRRPTVCAMASDPTPYPDAGPARILRPSVNPTPRSFSVFPSLVDPRERKQRSDEPKSPDNLLKSTPNSTVELEAAPVGMVQTGPGTPEHGQSALSVTSHLRKESFSTATLGKDIPAPELSALSKECFARPDENQVNEQQDASSPTETQVSDSESNSGSVSDVPHLSPSNHAGSSNSATVSSFSPQTPDDFLPLGGLQSHPVDPSMYSTSPRRDSVTALPIFQKRAPLNSSTSVLPTPSASMDHDEDFFVIDAKKRTLMPAKPSLAAMRSLFGRKNSPSNQRLGAGGLGGFVAPT